MDSIHVPKSGEANDSGPSHPRSAAELRSPTAQDSSHTLVTTENVTKAGKTTAPRKKTEMSVMADVDSEEEINAVIDSITDDIFASPKPLRPGEPKRSLRQ
ncbi:hypothetical protein LTR85_010352 [Meristemomyces frigidus]|nr:hypothetical protein LTR85_010352 [Meristemomyces frigidus]